MEVKAAHTDMTPAPQGRDLEKLVISATYTWTSWEERVGVRNMTLQMVTLQSHGRDN